jgi:hypothetical protein
VRSCPWWMSSYGFLYWVSLLCHHTRTRSERTPPEGMASLKCGSLRKKRGPASPVSNTWRARGAGGLGAYVTRYHLRRSTIPCSLERGNWRLRDEPCGDRVCTDVNARARAPPQRGYAWLFFFLDAAAGHVGSWAYTPPEEIAYMLTCSPK